MRTVRAQFIAVAVALIVGLVETRMCPGSTPGTPVHRDRLNPPPPQRPDPPKRLQDGQRQTPATPLAPRRQLPARAVPQPAAPRSIRLAKAGQPAATIVIPAQAHERVKLGATELQTYVRKVCGVDLPIRTDGKRVEGTGIYIGRCGPTRDADLPGATLNPESYAIRVRGGDVYLTGRYPTPTYFAVASFIEEALGVRWLAPGDDWEYVPPETPGELEVEIRDVVKVPDTSPRLWSGHTFFSSWTRWGLRNKTVQGEVIPRRQFQNQLFNVFPPSKYAKEHPEYYPLIDGKRWIPPEGFRYWRPCESNPDVIRITVEHARKAFDRRPDLDSFSLGMDDISHLCGCDNCRALDPRPDSYEKKEFSDRHYKFVNTVAREIAKTHPDRYIGTLIYAISRTPPETVQRLEPNVFAYITEVSASWGRPGVREEDQALTREWARRCRHLSRYEYFGLGTFTPRYYPHFMAEQMKFDKSLGLEGMYAELNTFLPHTAPMIWALARLHWDASLEIDALLQEFFRKAFGAAAPTMARYFDSLERAWNEAAPRRSDWEHRDIFIQAQAIAPADVEKGLALLDDALAQADSDLVRRRIEIIRAGLQYAGYAIRGYALSEEIIPRRIATAADMDKVTAQVLELMTLSAERERFWADAMERQDLLGENLRGLAAKGYLMIGRVPNLERGAVIGAGRLLVWCAAHDPARFEGLWTKLGSIRGGVGDVVRAGLRPEQHAHNLLTNPSFEDVVATSSPESRDTTPAAGWKTYGDADWAEFSRQAEGRQGAAVGVRGARSGAVYLQSREATPGQVYFCSVYARATGGDAQPSGYLSIRFQKPDGSWHPLPHHDRQVYMVPGSEWQPLMLAARAPEGAGRVVCMFGGKNQPQGSMLLFDDASLNLLPQGRQAE